MSIELQRNSEKGSICNICNIILLSMNLDLWKTLRHAKVLNVYVLRALITETKTDKKTHGTSYGLSV